IGLALLGAAVVSAVISSRGVARENAFATRPGGRVWPWLFAASGLTGSVALVIFLARGESAGVRALWLASLALLVASLFRRGGAGPAADGGPIRLPELCVLLALVSVTLAFRLFRLGELPARIDGDISSYGLQALQLLESAPTRWFWIGWGNHSLLSYELM